MSEHLEAGTWAAPATAGMPSWSSGPIEGSGAGEDDGKELPSDEPLAPWDDNGWPTQWGAARLGIP